MSAQSQNFTPNVIELKNALTKAYTKPSENVFH